MRLPAWLHSPVSEPAKLLTITTVPHQEGPTENCSEAAKFSDAERIESQTAIPKKRPLLCRLANTKPCRGERIAASSDCVRTCRRRKQHLLQNRRWLRAPSPR